MKKTLILIALFAFTLTSCSVNTSGGVAIDSDDLTYFEDTKTGLCYSIVASRKTFSFSASGLGLACVPCEQAKKSPNFIK